MREPVIEYYAILASDMLPLPIKRAHTKYCMFVENSKYAAPRPSSNNMSKVFLRRGTGEQINILKPAGGPRSKYLLMLTYSRGGRRGEGEKGEGKLGKGGRGRGQATSWYQKLSSSHFAIWVMCESGNNSLRDAVEREEEREGGWRQGWVIHVWTWTWRMFYLLFWFSFSFSFWFSPLTSSASQLGCACMW